MFESFELSLPLGGSAEAEEVQQARRRDAAVWTAWYDRYFPLLYRYALARTGRREDAEDIASQAFVRAVEAIDSFNYRGRPVLAWLYRITHNLVTDRVRRNQRRPAVALSEVSARDLPVADDGLPRIELLDALSRLRDDQREVVVLRFMTSLTAREVGAVLGKSEAAVYSLQVRALANLRRALEEK